MGDSQAKPRSAGVTVTRRIHTVKALENEWQVLCRNASALVAHRATDLTSFAVDIDRNF
jgi:hypothetical protein